MNLDLVEQIVVSQMPKKYYKPSIIYSKDFLLNDLYRASISMRREEYVYFHADKINELVDGFDFEFLHVSNFHVDKKFELDGEVTNAVAYTSPCSVDNYLRSQKYDDFSFHTYLNTGAALFNETIRSLPEWSDHKFYKMHCTVYNYHSILSISFHYPHHKKTFVAFDYLRAPWLDFSADLTEEFVEYITYPLFLGWLRVYGAICDETLKEWLSLCVGMTPPRFQVLRALNERGIVNRGQIAGSRGLSIKTIDRHIENAYEQLLRYKPDWTDYSGNAGRVLALSQAYRFFAFGCGQVSRKLPRRFSLTSHLRDE